MKKLYIIAILSMIFISNVNAQEIYYENNNGVILNEHEYNIISEFYWKGYQEYLTNKDYEFLKKNGLFENEIETKEINDSNINDSNFNLLSISEHTTANKSLKMSTSCSTNCLVAISLNWINLPKIRSYDILGIYIDNTSIKRIDNTIIETNKGRSNYAYTNKASNGIGTSFKLPTDVTYLRISQTLTVEKKGSINASYQHATKTISYANSKKYTFSKTGIGGVFSFNTGIQDYYDCMLGVQTNLN